MRTIVGLAIVIAVICGLSWILRQVKAPARAARSRERGLASVAALTLGSGPLGAPRARRQRLRAARERRARRDADPPLHRGAGARRGPARARGASDARPGAVGPQRRPRPARGRSRPDAACPRRPRGPDRARCATGRCVVEPQLQQRRPDPAAGRRADARAGAAVHGHRLQPHPDRARLHPHGDRHHRPRRPTRCSSGSRCS